MTTLPTLAAAARAVLGDHSCSRCHWPTERLMEHPEYHPECILRRVLDGKRHYGRTRFDEVER